MNQTPNHPLSIVMVEDSVQDAELEVRELIKGGFRFTVNRVETKEELLRVLETYEPDLILSDYSLPTFDGLSALRLSRERRPRSPFIFISGTIGEERAIEAMREGATDYIIKGRLGLGALAVKVRRALDEAARLREHTEMEERLRHLQKLESVGRLAGGIAHDYNNLLTIIMAYTQEIEDRASADPLVKECVTEVLKASNQAASLTRQLLAFSRKQLLAPMALDLNRSMADAANMLRRTLGEDVSLTVEPGPGLSTVWADPGQVFQVLLNLCVNARDAMPRGGRIAMKAVNLELDDAFVAAHPGSRGGRHVALSVRDTGEGIPDAVRAHVFEPFFTTKDVGKGTGLGLSTVFGIMEQSGGTVAVESAVGEGSTFTLYFPAVDLPAAHPAETRPSLEDAPGHGTVVLAEDSEPLRLILSATLRRHGFEVLEAADGLQALALADSHPGPIRLLVVDSVMPGLRGAETAERFRRARPEAKVVHMSGYSEGRYFAPGQMDTGAAFLQKPFNAETLVRVVRETLEA